MSQLELKLSSGVSVNEVLSSFHNTIHFSDEEVKAADAVCKTQEDRIMAIFHKHNRPLTPFELESLYCEIYPRIPITSIRRSLTNLTSEKKLIKSDKADKSGEYGKPNHSWRINRH